MTPIRAWQEGGKPVLLVIGESGLTSDRYQKLLTSIGEVEYRERIPSVVEQLSNRLAVVIFDQTVVDEVAQPFIKGISELRPWCQFIQIKTQLDPDDERDESDGSTEDNSWSRARETVEILGTSLTTSDFRSRIKQTLYRAAFFAALHEFYRLERTVSTLPASSSERVEHLAIQQSLKTTLTDLQRRLKIDQFSASTLAARVCQQYVTEPDNLPRQNEPTIETSKYRPPRCPKCKESWNSNGPTQPGGYIPLAAYIYQCLQCRNVFNSSKAIYQRTI